MTTFLIISFAVAYLLVVWFETSAFIEYAQLFKLTKYLKIDEYLEVAETTKWTYLEFLNEYYADSFFVKLCNCPICMAPWLAILLSIISFSPVSIAAIFGISFLGLNLYNGFLVLRKYVK